MHALKEIPYTLMLEYMNKLVPMEYFGCANSGMFRLMKKKECISFNIDKKTPGR